MASFIAMKSIVSVILILSLGAFVFGQGVQLKPLTQAEYVKLLYSLEKNPRLKTEIIDAIRSRGIGFELTDGLRGLTRSKSGADPELRRTLEEAARRRANPESFVLPSETESNALITKARGTTLSAVEEMPDFVVKQMIQRSVAYAGTNNFQSLDRLIVAVSYRTPDISGAKGAEEYKVLSVNGVLQDKPKSKGSYEEFGGTSSTGEFVTMLSTIFKSESQTEFTAIDTDTIRDRKAIVYRFQTDVDKARQVITIGGSEDSTLTGMKGKLWIDRENGRVLRVESQATEIPTDFRVRAASRIIDYDWVSIADEKYLLPISSDVRLTARQGREVYETRNVIRFKEYQKFGSEVKILDDDVVVVEEDKPVQEKPAEKPIR